MEESQYYTPDFLDGPKVQIIGAGGGSFILNMVDRTCACRRWELIGLPYPHAISAIYGYNQHPEEFEHACYLVSTYLNVYDHYINPTSNEDIWSEVNDWTRVIPSPIGKMQRGRKAIARRKEPEEIENGLKASKSTSTTSR